MENAEIAREESELVNECISTAAAEEATGVEKEDRIEETVEPNPVEQEAVVEGPSESRQSKSKGPRADMELTNRNWIQTSIFERGYLRTIARV